MATKTQLRGNCQCCGRDQAVLATTGTLAKHGYTVKGGWFQGVCSGHHHRAMQDDRSVTDRIVAEVRSQVAELRKTAQAYRVGTAHPARIAKASARPGEDATIAWDEAPDWMRNDARRSAIYALENRAAAGEHFANDLEALANAMHGQPLREEKVSAGPAPILAGERRISTKRGVLTATSVVGAWVSWRDERGLKSRMSSRAWRALELSV